MANIFVSHRGSDAAEAERLASDLAKGGHRVWLDVWDIHVGDSVVARIDEGLAGANYFVLCLSEDGVYNPWMSREWYAALARQLSGHSIMLLPIRLTGGAPPAILSDIRYADATVNYDAAVNEILTAIRLGSTV